MLLHAASPRIAFVPAGSGRGSNNSVNRRDVTEQLHQVGVVRPDFSRWVAGAVVIAAAVVLSAGASLMLPKRYTATASLIIDLPAGGDSRAAGAVSPVYIESLKTYEHFASSDSIFREAIDHLGLRARLPRTTIESLKSSVLRISKPASTRILTISATLGNPVEAQRLAQYIAGRTVELNHTLESQSAHDAAADAESIFKTASERLQRADRAREEFSRTHRVESLSASVDNMNKVRFDLQRELGESRASLPEMEAQAAGGGPERADEIEGVRARIAAAVRADEELAKNVERDFKVLEDLKERRDELDAEQRGARAEAEAAKNRWNDTRASFAYQGERISVLDPGIVPERPSAPNVKLNVAVAFLLSLLGAALWLAYHSGFFRRRVGYQEHGRHAMYGLGD